MGGKASKGTPADRRLKENKRTMPTPSAMPAMMPKTKTAQPPRRGGRGR